MLDQKLEKVFKEQYDEMTEERNKYYNKIKRILPQIKNKPEILTESDKRYIKDAEMIITRLLKNWTDVSNKTLERAISNNDD